MVQYSLPFENGNNKPAAFHTRIFPRFFNGSAPMD